MATEESGSSEMIDFILYMFVLGPSVEWCLKSPRVNRGRPGSWRGIALAVALLSAIAGVKLSFELVGRETNHFATLGVRVDATTAEIKRAYRDISLIHHPDKKPGDKHAAENFIRYQTAYEVIKDATKRDVYNKFGAAGLDDKSGGDLSSQLTSLSMFYVIWLVVGYLLTMGKASEDGRTWAFCGLLSLAVFEYQTRILSVDYLSPIFPHSTVHEKVELLHKLFPPFLHGARMISQVIFMDISLVNKMRLEEMHIKVDDLFQMVAKLPIPPSVTARLPADQANESRALGGAVDPSATVSPTREGTLSMAAAAAEDTASRLAAVGFQPLNAAPSTPTAAAPAATPGAVHSAEVTAAVAAAETAASARSRDRMTNVVFFFVAYAAFKYAADKEFF